MDDLTPLAPSFTIAELVRIARRQPRGSSARRALMIEQITRHLADHPFLQKPALALALDAMAAMPREWFVPPEYRNLAYLPMAGDIGHGQSISNPFLVAAMTAAIRPNPSARVLDVGTGSGYQAAILSRLVAKVVSIEIVAPLAEQARDRLHRIGCANVEVVHGDATVSGESLGAFDGVIVAAGCDVLPSAISSRLASTGRLVMPLGSATGPDQLTLIETWPHLTRTTELGPVSFVPLTGRNGRGSS